MDTRAFPTALRERRSRMRVSQLELALLVGTTQRHVSFLESGRSAPGRQMVVRLAESLRLPLRERNQLLAAAGFAPEYAESSLDGPDLAPVRDAIKIVLDGHEPYPAVAVGPTGDLITSNAAFERLVGHAPAALRTPGANAYRLALHPDGLGGRVVNLAEWGRHVLERVNRTIVDHPDPALTTLLDELTGYLPADEPTGEHLGYAVPARIRSSAGELRLLTTVTTFATAVDVTLAELKLEAFLPADSWTASALAAAAADAVENKGGRGGS